MSMKEDLRDIEIIIEEGERLADRYGPSDPKALDVPIGDIGFQAIFTQWRGRALSFVQLQTGAYSEYAREFSARCKAEGSCGDLIAGLNELKRVEQGIMDGLFERKGIRLFL